MYESPKKESDMFSVEKPQCGNIDNTEISIFTPHKFTLYG